MAKIHIISVFVAVFLFLSFDNQIEEKRKTKESVANLCVPPNSTYHCSALSNTKTTTGYPFYYYSDECNPTLNPNYSSVPGCLQMSACKLCFIPEQVKEAKHKLSFQEYSLIKKQDKCPPCVYEFWKIDKDTGKYTGKTKS